ncbi:MAG: putative TIM-barrel fold metal-dependent hydrolase [Actinomycetia bacterium]|nr:putative TIM-barrel fold metal-dependent hydrolase [Actinomycetes bacterium]
MHSGRRVCDADAHVIEPGAIFGPAHEPGRNPMDLPPTTPFVACGGADLADQWENGFDAPSYLRAMDAQGIDTVVLYPSIGLFVPFQPELSAAESADACRRYDDWVAQYCDHEPGRLAAVGIAPLADPRLAADEARRVASLGLVGMMVRPNHLYGRNLGDEAYDPFYDVLEETGLVLSVHEGLGLRGATIGRDRFDGFALRHALSHPMEQMAACASLMLDGALERHPNLRVAFLESGTGWLPYWLARLDDHREWMSESETNDLSLSPSEYFARQCIISTDPEDPLAANTAAYAGSDHLVWASDFPHPDAAFPDAIDEFLEQSPGLSSEQLDQLFWDNPRRFYRLETRFK